jgi:steroid 5-alpha reductase family enzyme
MPTNPMATEWPRLWLAALLFAVVLMALSWRLALRLGNAGIVDIAWAAGFAPMALWFAIAGTGAPARRALIAAMVVA